MCLVGTFAFAMIGALLSVVSRPRYSITTGAVGSFGFHAIYQEKNSQKQLVSGVAYRGKDFKLMSIVAKPRVHFLEKGADGYPTAPGNLCVRVRHDGIFVEGRPEVTPSDHQIIVIDSQKRVLRVPIPHQIAFGVTYEQLGHTAFWQNEIEQLLLSHGMVEDTVP